ncbi:MAG TPA: hypothetical protein VJN01_06560 [Xanthomonadales bacterium]|nr:hypothetical protein [Xanthomonadales bacterium]
MADVDLVAQTWTELYTASGVASTTAVYVQNKGADELFVFVGAEPTANSKVGWLLQRGDTLQVAAGAAEIWAKSDDSSCKVFIVAS